MVNRIREDPRIDPRIKAIFGDVPFTSLPDVASREELLASVASTSINEPEIDEASYESIAPSAGLTIRTLHVPSKPDGNMIALQVIVPMGEGPRPCVYYIHGGGMMMGSCFDSYFRAWGRLVASFGVTVIMVDFRNALMASSRSEVAPFPAGLNDCVSGLRWVHANAIELAIDPSRIVVGGESGGGNLALATGLALNRASDIDLISGIYVMCPYLAGEWKGEPGSSALENAGILMDARSNYGPMAYGIDELHKQNPLAWPAFARESDLAGFPPVIISVNECDPLRDDGVDFYRLLLRAGVSARCRTVMGTVHATEVICLPCPDISRDAARQLAAFCTDGY